MGGQLEIRCLTFHLYNVVLEKDKDNALNSSRPSDAYMRHSAPTS